MGITSVVITTSGRGNHRELDISATETVSKADAMPEEKGENKEINELENGEHSACCSECHVTTGKVVHVHWYKMWSWPKRT